jgi:hypothetical protein
MTDSGSPPRPPPAQPRGPRDLRKVDAELARLKAEREKKLASDEVEELSDVDLLIEENEGAIAAARGEAPASGIAFRRSPRFSVAASVLLSHDGATARLPLVNVSSTGALIGCGEDTPRLRPGALLFLTLSADDDPTRKVEVDARVVREHANGTAVDWSEDVASIEAVADLLRALPADEV